MTDEIDVKSENAQDGARVACDEIKDKNETDPKETKRTVSFNRDVHVKRFGKPREVRASSSENKVPSIRKEPFTHLSEKELIKEANKVLEQAGSVTCTADHPPEKFFSLPHRRKLKEDKLDRRNSDDTESPDNKGKSSLGRSSSDVNSRRRKERTSLSTLFRRAQRNKSPDNPVVVTTKPVAIVKRSKSDVSDLKSNTKNNAQLKPIRKRSGSETEEFLKSLRNKKTQLSPIIESSPREDYFKKTPPLDIFQRQKESDKVEKSYETFESSKVNPLEKPPRYKSPEKQEPKPPVRVKRGKSSEKESSPSITETPKRRTDVKKTLLVDEIDSFKTKDINPIDVKDRIKESIRKIEENIYGDKEMIHSSQQPPDKPPLTRGHTVDQIVRILKEDSMSPPPNSYLISPSHGTNVNQPFSYTKPSLSPDPNLFVRNTSPDRIPSPVNKMSDKGVVYAHVVKDRQPTKNNNMDNHIIHKTLSPSRGTFGNLSDEDEGLGYEDRYKYSTNHDYTYRNKDNNNYNSIERYNITDSPIKPRYIEYKLTNFEDYNREPIYTNEYHTEESKMTNYIDTFRGRADGMDTKRKPFESEIDKADLNFNELSHRRQQLESRLNDRKFDRDRIQSEEPVVRYLDDDPVFSSEQQNRMKATEKYVNETAKYYRHTLERDGVAESNVTEEYNKYDNDNHRTKYHTENRVVHKNSKGDVNTREYFDEIDIKPSYRDGRKIIPPEPEYEPPSLEFNTGKPILSPHEYKEKKYKVRKNVTSSHDLLQSGQKYKAKDESFGKRKGHYSSNPEIAQEREDYYANLPNHTESYHNSLRRQKNKDKFKQQHDVSRHDSGDSRDYYRGDMSPRRYEIDNRLVDSGIENDFRKESSGEIHRSKLRKHESDDDVRDTSLFLASERRHTEDNYPSEQIYANGEYIARFEDFRNDDYKNGQTPRDRSDEDSHVDTKLDRYRKSPYDDKVSAKPPKVTKKLSGLEKVKQLFSRDSSKKSKKEKEIVQPKTRTRVLKSPEHLVRKDSDYRRYTDPEPSDIEIKKNEYDPKEEDKKYKISREDLDRYRSPDCRERYSERKYRETDFDERFEKSHHEGRRYQERIIEKRRVPSSDRESDQHSRPSDAESDRHKSRSRPPGHLDSPALAERYRERRRLATPSPTPSPPRRPTAATSAGNWFKSLDRLGRKRANKSTKVENKAERESILTTEDESTRKTWSKPTKPLNSPAKNLRFFGDTDQDSDVNAQQNVTKSKSHPQHKPHSTLRKTISNSSTGIDEIDRAELKKKSYSYTNLHREELSESPRPKQYYKRNLHNISEIHSNSETESNLGRKVHMKPPIDRRSRSHSSSKTLKEKDVRRSRNDDRGSSTEIRGSKKDLRDLKHRRVTGALNSGESSTEGDSSHNSQRSVVYLHATTVGDIPDPGRISRNRSRDDVSSVNSSNVQLRTTTKSFSIFAPWTPKHYPDHQDVHYAQRPRKPRKETPVKKYSSNKNLAEDRPATLQKNKSYSQTTLTRNRPQSRLTSSNTTLYRKPEKTSTLSRKSASRDNKKSQSSELLNKESERERLSRSISMPKDNNKKAGWFKLTSKTKKPEVNSRVR